MAKITWFGHAAFIIRIADKTVLIDPFLDENPTSPIKASEITKADVVFVTHDHGDHLGDAFNICRRTDATFAAVIELTDYAEENGIKKVAGLNIGGSVNMNGINLTVTQATHTSSKGVATGVILESEDKTIYHAGDTGLFGDMRLLGELYEIDVALLPIGGYYTMDAKQACEAVKMINPDAVIPMHYKTFSVLAQSADEFIKCLKEKTPEVKAVPLKPGESYQF